MLVHLSAATQRCTKLTLVATILLLPLPAAAQSLTLSTYLQQVSEQHQGIQSAAAATQGAALRSNEANAMLAPTVFANVQQMVDKKPNANPAFQGDKLSADSYAIGVSKITDFGLAAKLTYSTGQYDISGANPAFLAEPKYYESRTTLELSQPLWRNMFGRETRAMRELSRSQAMATSATEQHKVRMLHMEAEQTYWRLALARDSVNINKASLQRAEKIRAWSANRAKLELADRSDLLQAEAAVAARNLELQVATDEAEAAARAFNALRSKTGSAVPETLDSLSNKTGDKITAPTRAGDRSDVVAAQEYAKLAAANAIVASEKYRPTLEIFGSYAMNGKDAKSSEATDQSISSDFPTTAVGLRFSAPLGGSISATRSGYAKEAIAAGSAAERRRFEQDRDWLDLSNKLQQAKGRLKLLQALESLQKQKLEHERNRQQRGRSTMYQVLLSEQDYANAQLNRLRTQAEMLLVVAQMGTFGGSK